MNSSTDVNVLGSAAGLSSALSTGAISAVELLDLHLAQVERLNPTLNALVTFDVERARNAAKASDERRAKGGTLGPLDGLPISIKDSIATGGLRTTSGSPLFAEYVPQEDAVAVARLREAGAVIFAKSNLPPFAGDFQSVNPVFGRTLNPWDLGRTPGGSSGGSACAVATGLSAIDLGSDIGGSIRNPAHYCGVYGHKPTYQVIPITGHLPPPPGVLSVIDMATVGPLARSAEDLALAFEALVKPTSREAPLWAPVLAPPRHQRLQDFRVAVWTDDPNLPTDSETRAMLERVADELERAGVRVDRRARPAFDVAAAVEGYLQLLMPLFVAAYPEGELEGVLAQLASASPLRRKYMERLVNSRHATLAGHFQALEVQAQAKAAWAAFFDNHDALLCPVVPTPAFENDDLPSPFSRVLAVDGREEAYGDLLLWNGVFGNFAHLPSTARPISRSALGLPMGVQILGPAMGDRTTLRLAALLDAVFGGYQPPPLATTQGTAGA